MLMFICIMQAKGGAAHRESMYDLQDQGQLVSLLCTSTSTRPSSSDLLPTLEEYN